jgi:hypothetical protein
MCASVREIAMRKLEEKREAKEIGSSWRPNSTSRRSGQTYDALARLGG